LLNIAISVGPKGNFITVACFLFALTKAYPWRTWTSLAPFAWVMGGKDKGAEPADRVPLLTAVFLLNQVG